MINSKNKGARGEREFAEFCREKGFPARRGQQYSGIEGDDVVGLPGVHIEVKRVQKLNINEAVKQAVRDSRGLPFIVAHRKNGEDWLVTMCAKDWFVLYKTWQYCQSNTSTG